jgi:hypothetical protein
VLERGHARGRRHRRGSDGRLDGDGRLGDRRQRHGRLGDRRQRHGRLGTGGTGGTGVNPPECKSISRDMPCTAEGQQCPNLVCGLADSGTRDCNCATTWMCTACDFTNSRFMTKPEVIEPCPSGVAKGVDCEPSIDGTVCGPLTDGDYCACYVDPTDGQIWDCDSAPSSWGL